MIDLSNLDNVKHNPILEDISQVLSTKTQNTSIDFFRIQTAYFLAKVAGSMRAYINTKDRGDISINLYVLSFASSGFGKGHSIHILENSIFSGFRKNYTDNVLPYISTDNIHKLAIDEALNKSTDEGKELEKLEKEYESYGPYPFSFDSGTVPAVKQLRQKLLLAKSGSINLQIDEIGSNLIGSTELLNTFLELYDQGLLKQKLIKNTADNKRYREIEGKTPANLLLFGTPSKLMDGGRTEDAFYSFLEAGYARRCLFNWGTLNRASKQKSAQDIYYDLINSTNTNVLDKYKKYFESIADPLYHDFKIELDDLEAILLLEYKIYCETLADKFPEHKEIHKSEMSHRYFKALKLAGVFAFIELSPKITSDNLWQAIKLVEQSGKSFEKLFNRERAHEKLAKYIINSDKELTHADLFEDLPYYSSSSTSRNEMINLAMAWGFKNHMIIKKTHLDGIEFFSGEALQETNLNELIISYSPQYASNYKPGKIKFNDINLKKLFLYPNLNWCNHTFQGNHRCKENLIPGFNLIVLDVDDGVNINAAIDLLKEYNFALHTTKRHTNDNHRFRLVIPTNYILNLNNKDYKEFINNVCSWLPFNIDASGDVQSKKWATNEKGTFYINESGNLLDVLPFIPKTTKNEYYKKSIKNLNDLSNIERWFLLKINEEGNRNNYLIKYAMMLVDSNMVFTDIENIIKQFNKKLQEPLSDNEIDNTILKTVITKLKD